MLSDRERQCLASIEDALRRTDPRLEARFRSLERVRIRRPAAPRRGRDVTFGSGQHRSMHSAGVLPCVMLAVGLVLLLAGAAAGAMTIVVAGAVVALLTLGVAATTGNPRPGPGFA